jgi:hypothetical protein
MLRRSWIGKARHPLQPAHLAEVLDQIADERDADEAKHDGGNGLDELDDGLDELLFALGGELVRVDRGDDADRRGDEDGDESDDERTGQQRHEAKEILPGAVRDPLPEPKKKRR